MARARRASELDPGEEAGRGEAKGVLLGPLPRPRRSPSQTPRRSSCCHREPELIADSRSSCSVPIPGQSPPATHSPLPGYVQSQPLETALKWDKATKHSAKGPGVFWSQGANRQFSHLSLSLCHLTPAPGSIWTLLYSASRTPGPSASLLLFLDVFPSTALLRFWKETAIVQDVSRTTPGGTTSCTHCVFA